MPMDLLALDLENVKLEAGLATEAALRAIRDSILEEARKEDNRNARLGLWKDVPFSASNYTAGGGGTWTVASGDVVTHAYCLIGKVMTVWFSFSNTTTAANATSLIIPIPDGLVCDRYTEGIYRMILSGVGIGTGLYTIGAGGTTISFFWTLAGTTFANITDGVSFYGHAVFLVR